MHWLAVVAAVAIIATALAVVPGRAQMPPLIESDYCYLLTAADRMYAGYGPTAPPPVAPLQPWTWQTDWAFLTHWPIGYPILICAFRRLFDLSTIQACKWISVLGCATALVGWFVWIKRSIPLQCAGIAVCLLACVAAGSAGSASSLINPSTDLMVVAALPFILLAILRGTESIRNLGSADTDSPRPLRNADASGSSVTHPQTSSFWLALGGLSAGGLFWFRYASVFVPVGIGLFLLFEMLVRKRICQRAVAVFAICAALPVMTLLVINGSFGSGVGVQEQLNLGQTSKLDFSFGLMARAWWNFSALGFYDHHAFTHWVYALWPIGVVMVSLAIRPVRLNMKRFLRAPGVTLSACVLLTMLVMLIVATAVFGDKYDYVGLERYYVPGRPIYFLLFVAPILLIPRRLTRVLAALAFVVACSWIAQQEWPRPYVRWMTANRETTSYGQHSIPFSPHAADLYDWLGKQTDADLIVVSNFHEYITLETKIPALPIPKDVPTLQTWIARLREARGIDNPRVLFVLDSDNRWRDYWIPPPAKIIETFDLADRPRLPATISSQVFEYHVLG